MRLLKKIGFYCFLFVLFLTWNLIIQPINIDEIWNYGFAHNIYQGLVPYRDFNMILTPFYPFLMSLPFFVFGSSMLVFHIGQALILTTTCFFLFQLFQKRAWLILLFFFFPLAFSYPNYNLFLFFLYVIVLFLEERKGNDYFIGFLLGLLLLTKQSVGICLLLPSLYYFKQFGKLKKRFLGFLVPVGIFLIYLGFSGSFSSFLDLCIFGLFDFASGNGNLFNMYFFLTVFLILGTCFFIKKYPFDIKPYYTLAFFSVIIPLFDLYHFQVGVLAFLMLILWYQKKESVFPYSLFTLGIIFGISIITFANRIQGPIIYPNTISHFEYRLLDSASISFTEEVNSFMKEHSEEEFVFLNSNGYYFRLVNDMKIGYLDLINTGNWGYQGSDKLFEAVKQKKNAIFFVDKSELSEVKQTDKRVLKYVLETGKKIKTIGIYDIYILDS